MQRKGNSRSTLQIKQKMRIHKQKSLLPSDYSEHELIVSSIKKLGNEGVMQHKETRWRERERGRHYKNTTFKTATLRVENINCRN